MILTGCKTIKKEALPTEPKVWKIRYYIQKA